VKLKAKFTRREKLGEMGNGQVGRITSDLILTVVDGIFSSLLFGFGKIIFQKKEPFPSKRCITMCDVNCQCVSSEAVVEEEIYCSLLDALK
jgi:hypothetical protein